MDLPVAPATQTICTCLGYPRCCLSQVLHGTDCVLLDAHGHGDHLDVSAAQPDRPAEVVLADLLAAQQVGSGSGDQLHATVLGLDGNNRCTDDAAEQQAAEGCETETLGSGHGHSEKNNVSQENSALLGRGEPRTDPSIGIHNELGQQRGWATGHWEVRLLWSHRLTLFRQQRVEPLLPRSEWLRSGRWARMASSCPNRD